MRPLSTIELLGLWERAAHQSPVHRALTFLTAARPERPSQELAGLSIGRRDAQLLELRERTFGSELSALTACPQCRGPVEIQVQTTDLQALRRGEPAPELEVEVDGHKVRFRLPNSADLMALEGLDDLEASRRQLLDRCLLSGRDGLPAGALAEVVEPMARADPLADIQWALSCPACGHSWEAAFDIVSFFWRELHAWACGLLREVHALAAAYGWREADILALSPARRQVYLDLVGA